MTDKKETKITFSHEHIGSTTGKPERDTHREHSDKPGKIEKIAHNPVTRVTAKIPSRSTSRLVPKINLDTQSPTKTIWWGRKLENG